MIQWDMALGFFVSAAVVALISVALQAMNDIIWHELKELCQRRDRRDRFDAIYDGYEDAVVGLEVSRLLAVTNAVAWAAAWWYTGYRTAAWQSQGMLVFGFIVILLGAVVWIPIAVGRIHSTPVVYHLWPMMWLIQWVVAPLSFPVSLASAALRRMSDQTEPPDEEEAFEEEILAMVTEGLHEGHLEADARQMIEGVIVLGDANVADIMTPRSKMDVISADLGWDELLGEVARTTRTRLPVYEGSLDKIIGVLYVKDLLVELARPACEPRRPLRKILREVRFVPDSQPLDDLLQDFLQTRNHLAMVVNEYQGVVGLVTIEDVLEEIVGEIVDESDVEQAGEIHRIDTHLAEIHGRAHVSEINEQLGLNLPEPDDFDTIAGLVINELGRIPKSGETVEWGNVRITVLEANHRKIERVRLESLEPLSS